MTSPLPPATIITSTRELQKHIDQWAHEPLLALDTESNSLHAYQEQVCLIQLSTREADFIIDPLLVESLDGLSGLLADPEIETVFHAAEYDVMCLKRDFNFQFAAMFDTMLAARICGADKLGLGSMLEQFFGVKVNKKHQRANWGERPLSDDMLHYAQYDTHFLPALRDHWRAELEAMGRWDEAREAFRALTDIPAAEHRFDPDGFWRINGAQRLTPTQYAILRALYLLREDLARQRDLPPFKIMADRTLLELTLAQPRSDADLRHVSGMTSGQIRRFGRPVLKAVKTGAQQPPPERPASPRRPSDEVLARYEALRTWRKTRARKRGVESDVIVSRDALWALARHAPASVEDLATIKELGPWKTEHYGTEILKVLSRINGSESSVS
jgi:ribonuclease D